MSNTASAHTTSSASLAIPTDEENPPSLLVEEGSTASLPTGIVNDYNFNSLTQARSLCSRSCEFIEKNLCISLLISALLCLLFAVYVHTQSGFIPSAALLILGSCLAISALCQHVTNEAVTCQL